MKILNLYAGIGGNRKLWGDEHEVTAIENVPEIAKIYQDFFPNDKVIVCDAHEYLLEHYKEFDFIWSSPPCPSHSRIRIYSAVARGQNEPLFPDMKLYEEIIFLEHYFKGEWVVENVCSYYEPLIKPYEIQRHYFWSSFVIPKSFDVVSDSIADGKIEFWEKKFGFDLSKYKLKVEKKTILRNCVDPKLALKIFNLAFKERQQTI